MLVDVFVQQQKLTVFHARGCVTVFVQHQE